MRKGPGLVSEEEEGTSCDCSRENQGRAVEFKVGE